MDKPRAIAKLTAAVLVLCGATGVATAQIERSGGANSQLAQQLQQAIAERARLQAENANLKKDLDDAKRQLAADRQQLTSTKSTAGVSAAQLSSARATSRSAEKNLEIEKSRVQELVSHYRDTVETLRGTETQRAELQKKLSTNQAALGQCADRNAKLYAVATTTLNRYEHQGFFSYLERAEPFTRLKRTQIQNFADEYRTRANELRVRPPAAPPKP